MDDSDAPIIPAQAFSTRLAAGAAAIVICVVALVSLSSWQSRQQFEERARITTDNLTKTLEAAIAGSIEKADITLNHVIDDYQRQRLRGNVDAQAMQAAIRQEAGHHDYIDELRLVDAEGNVLFDSDGRSGQRISVADRSYFQRLRDRPDSGLVFSKPLHSRLSNKLVMVIARAMRRADGRFDGIAVAFVTIERLTRTLNEIDVGSHGLMTLRDEDLGIIARYPEPAGVRVEIGNATVSPQLRTLVQQGRRFGSFHVSTPLDGVDRVASYRRVGSYPLHIVVGLAAQDYLREWRLQTMFHALLAAVLSAITVAFAWLLQRSHRRETAAMDTLSKQARSDFLTELNNRRCFLELAEAELARTVRYGGDLSLLMLDIDRFKRINDTHGHKGGDLVLKALARLFGETLREVDITGRIGGEEFAILLPATDGAHAVEVAERLRQTIANAEVDMGEGSKTHFTVSIGVASLARKDQDIDGLLSLADRAMYEAKQTGRNKVCSEKAP